VEEYQRVFLQKEQNKEINFSDNVKYDFIYIMKNLV